MTWNTAAQELRGRMSLAVTSGASSALNASALSAVAARLAPEYSKLEGGWADSAPGLRGALITIDLAAVIAEQGMLSDQEQKSTRLEGGFGSRCVDLWARAEAARTLLVDLASKRDHGTNGASAGSGVPSVDDWFNLARAVSAIRAELISIVSAVDGEVTEIARLFSPAPTS